MDRARKTSCDSLCRNDRMNRQRSHWCLHAVGWHVDQDTKVHPFPRSQWSNAHGSVCRQCIPAFAVNESTTINRVTRMSKAPVTGFTLSCSMYSAFTPFKPNLRGMIITNGFHGLGGSLGFLIRVGNWELIWHSFPERQTQFDSSTDAESNERMSLRIKVLSMATWTWTCLSNSFEAMRLNKYEIVVLCSI